MSLILDGSVLNQILLEYLEKRSKLCARKHKRRIYITSESGKTIYAVGNISNGRVKRFKRIPLLIVRLTMKKNVPRLSVPEDGGAGPFEVRVGSEVKCSGGGRGSRLN